MPGGELGILAEAQRETIRALEALTERLGARPGDESGTVPGRSLEGALETAAQAVAELTRATAANTQALGGLERELGGLPGLMAGLANQARESGSLLGSIFKSGLGLGPLARGLAGLFRGEDPRPPEPVWHAPPPPLVLEAALPTTPGDLARVERGEGDRPRTVVVQPQVTVNVNAMDSRSFLDRSDEIARAVREAMLHMHPVNDFIQEL